MSDDLRIWPIGPDDERFAEWHAAYLRSARRDDPDATVYSEAESRDVLRLTGGDQRFEALAAERDGQIVGTVMIWLPEAANRHMTRFFLNVDPAARHRGAGTALLAAAEQRARESGRTHAIADVDLRRNPAYAAFAERHGYELQFTAVVRRQPLPRPEALLDRLAADAALHHPGYSIVTTVGPVPAALAPGMCRLANRISLDAPSGDIAWEANRRTPEHVAIQDAQLTSLGRTRVTGFALVDGTEPGTEEHVAAFTCLVGNVPGDPSVEQWGTIVHPDDRGHRLGLAVKVAALRAAQRALPDKRYVETNNAETNEHMIAINEALGYTIYSEMGEFQKVLGEPQAR